MTDQHHHALLDTSASYVEAKVAFRNAILTAERAGTTAEEIAQLTGLSVAEIRAVLRTT